MAASGQQTRRMQMGTGFEASEQEELQDQQAAQASQHPVTSQRQGTRCRPFARKAKGNRKTG
jgi:hypothetical protein